MSTFDHMIVTLALAVCAAVATGLVVYAIAGLAPASVAAAIAAGVVGVARVFHAASLDL